MSTFKITYKREEYGEQEVEANDYDDAEMLADEADETNVDWTSHGPLEVDDIEEIE